MRRKNERFTDDADRVVKDIKRQTRRRFSSEDKIRIVLAGCPSSGIYGQLTKSNWLVIVA